MGVRSRRASDSPRSSLLVRVECHSGHRGEETPRRFELAGSWLEIQELLDRWLAPDHRYFRVRADDGGVYLLRHDVESQHWELVLQR